MISPKPSNPMVNLVLFVLTVLSVIFAGAHLCVTTDLTPNSTSDLLLASWRSLPSGLPFAVSLLAILLAHEFGHYLAGRYHHTHVTLPYFIPFPLSPFGTMGAFIQLKEPPRNKRILLDIGIAGPIAGLVVAIPILLYGLSLSKARADQPGSRAGLHAGRQLTALSAGQIPGFRQLAARTQQLRGSFPLLYWIRYFFTSQPLPMGGMDVMIHPVAWAGWAGLAGHRAEPDPCRAAGRRASDVCPAGQTSTRALWPFILGMLVLLGFVWSGWWLWAVLIFFLGTHVRRAAGPDHPARPATQGARRPGDRHFLPGLHPGPAGPGARRGWLALNSRCRQGFSVLNFSVAEKRHA